MGRGGQDEDTLHPLCLKGGRERGEIGQRADSASVESDAKRGREGGREVVWADGARREDEGRAGVVDVDAAFVVVVREGEGRDNFLLVKEAHGGELPVAVSTQDKDDVCTKGGVTARKGMSALLFCVFLCAAQSPPSGTCPGEETAAARGEAEEEDGGKHSDGTRQGKRGFQ